MELAATPALLLANIRKASTKERLREPEREKGESFHRCVSFRWDSRWGVEPIVLITVNIVADPGAGAFFAF
jgi:hypothetical protein